ncbi:MAG: sugar transferase [Deltaproteobacteria bacterium]|nr:sugar transferase [Deltaproteobacteria bacterium]
MRNIKRIVVPFIVMFVDGPLVVAAFFLSFLARYGLDIPEFTFKSFKESYLAMVFIYILAFAFAGLFRDRYRSHWEVIKKIFCGMVGGAVFSFIFLYVFRVKWTSFPTSILLIMVPMGTAVISIANIIILRVTKSLKTNLVIVGNACDDEVLVSRSRLEIFRVDTITQILNYENVDEILICEDIRDESQVNLLIQLLKRLNVNVSFSPMLYAELLSDVVKQECSLDNFATLFGRKSDLEEFSIRLFDIIASLVFLCLAAPMMFFLSILIKMTSSGPALFKQERVGKDGEIFVLYKFRTMLENAEGISRFKPAVIGDPRVTKVGRILRRTRLDELPQLINILVGDMSLVGPRPENLPRVRKHKALQGIRLAIKPGLTGLAQIRSCYDLNPKHKIKYDYLYIQRRSLPLNLFIILKTIPAVLSKKGW